MCTGCDPHLARCWPDSIFDTVSSQPLVPMIDLPRESRGEAPGRGRLAGRRVVVVGAGQTDYNLDDQPIGNGRAIAVLAAREGAAVVAVDRDGASAAETVALISQEGGTSSALVADVAEPQDIERMIEGAAQQLGGID